MSLKDTYEKIVKIKETSSTNDKVCLLTEYLLNDEFSTVIQLIYDMSKNYKIKTLPRMIPLKKGDLFSSKDKKTTNKDIFDYLNKLADQRGVSNEEKQELTKLSSVDEETYKVVQMIVRKDAKSGFSAKLINKAKPNFIETMPYCRCSTAKNKIHTVKWEEGVYAQEKVDGIFINIIIKEDKITLRSRNGNIIHQLDHITNWIKTNTNFKNKVLMGELLIKDGKRILPRKTGNGVFNSCIQGTAVEEQAKMAIVKLWDIVSYSNFVEGEFSVPYNQRLAKLKDFLCLDLEKKIFSLVPTKEVFSEDEAMKYYQLIRSKGGEGLIIKKKTALWKNHTSPDQIKIKNVDEAELRIVGWSYGEKDTKYEKLLGSLQCETDCGKVKVSISGFSDDQRKLNWNKDIGKIVTIEYESIINSKSKEGVYSLYLPRFKEIRFDRDSTDTLEDLQKR